MKNSRNVPKSWSLIICKRRLSWFGHLLRLPSETPAKRSLKAFVKTWKRSAGRPKTTWLSLILSDISKYSNINLSEHQEKDLESLEKICDDRKAWIKTVDCIMSSKKTKMQWWWWWVVALGIAVSTIRDSEFRLLEVGPLLDDDGCL